MTTNTIVHSTISQFVERQFPTFFRENGQAFVQFVKAYYEWMEQTGNALYYSRRYYDIKDIDATLDEFIKYFKNKYLVNIKFTTETNTRQLVKHALDLYRSKGTEREIKLLFQLVYGENIDIYYPSQDLFKLSDGEWYHPTYLELTISDNNTKLYQKEITGERSGAVAYIDNIIRRKVKNVLIDVAYISAVNGDFQVYEKIYPTDDSLNIRDCPNIIGSLSNVEISTLGTGQNYAVGDIVDIISDYGEEGKARVASIANQTGIIDFTMIDGGYGFTANADIYVANATFTISNATVTNTSLLNYFDFLSGITQPKVYLNYRSATGLLYVGNTITTYYGNGSVMGTGIIMSKNQTNTSAGVLLVTELSGSLNNTFHTTANAITANLTVSNGYYAVHATGNVIANSAECTFNLDTVSGTFVVGETIQQDLCQAQIKTVSAANVIILEDIFGTFKTNNTVTGLTSGATANLNNVKIVVGAINTNNEFYASNNSWVYNNNISGYISKVEEGTSAAFTFNTLSNTEVVGINSDIIEDYFAVTINASTYGFPGNTSGNLTYATIGDCLTYVNTTIGKIQTLIISLRGEQYTYAPLLVVDEPNVRVLSKLDNVLTISGATGNFTNGEIVTQSSTGARGMIKEDSNTSVLYVQRMRFYDSNNWVVTSNSTTTIVGSSSDVTANIVSIETQYGSAVMGHNATINSELVSGNGAVMSLEMLDSGFGYHNDETVYLTANSNGTGTSKLIKQGIGEGYYKRTGGFLSANKKLFDGDYWQNFSYDIISPILINKYKDMLNQVAHVAGTKMFGTMVNRATDNNSHTAVYSGISIV